MAARGKTVEEPLMVEPPLLDEDKSQMNELAQIAEIFKDDMTTESYQEIEEALDKLGGSYKPRGLHAKLAEVASKAERIPKNGRADPKMGGYQFVQVGDAADWLRPEMARLGLTMLPVQVRQEGDVIQQATRSGGSMNIQTVKQTWQITDSETGEFIHIESYGTGGDSGDKFSPKAQTNAMKYAILMTFMLSTGDDPEAARAEPEQGPGIQITTSNVSGVQQGGRQTKATGPQVTRIKELARERNLTPEAMVLLIGASLGGPAPDISSMEAVSDQQQAILKFIGELSFADAGVFIQTLESTEN